MISMIAASRSGIASTLKNIKNSKTQNLQVLNLKGM